jgi:uncharacterized MnhB-related membrane protein
VIYLQLGILLLVAASGTATALTYDHSKQVIGLTFFGLMLSIMFFVFQAPDVALSQIVVGTVLLPLMFLLCLSRLRAEDVRAERHTDRGDKEERRERRKQGGE